jgi:hypothetical protein
LGNTLLVFLASLVLAIISTHDFLPLIFDKTNILLGNASGPIGDLHYNGHLNPY